MDSTLIMKKLLIILFTLITSITFAQVKVLKVQGQPGIYGLANNATGDSLIFYVNGVRKAIPVISNVDLSNYYNKTQNDNLLATKVDTSYKDTLDAVGIVHIDSLSPTHHQISVNLSTDTTFSNASDDSVSSSLAVKKKLKADSTVLKGYSDTKEPAFSKNTAFNKNFDIVAGSVVDGKRFADSIAALRALSYSKLDSNYRNGVIQTVTSGSSVTVNNSTTWLIVNPASTLTSLIITLPSNPTGGQLIDMSFGGTINTTDAVVVTSLSVVANTGHGLVGSGAYSGIITEDHIAYRFNSSLLKWFRN